MKCYFIGSSLKTAEYQYTDVAFANNASEAKKLTWGWSENLQDDTCGEFIYVRAIRKPEYDYLFREAKLKEPHQVQESKLLRIMGWNGGDGDPYCFSCGLYSFEGEFPICSGCDMCEECGHEEGCPYFNVAV